MQKPILLSSSLLVSVGALGLAMPPKPEAHHPMICRGNCAIACNEGCPSECPSFQFCTSDPSCFTVMIWCGTN
jgi:hypothetical protein